MKNRLIEKIENLDLDKLNITKRKLTVNEKSIYILYIKQLTDRERLSKEIITPIVNYNDKEISNIDIVKDSVVYIDDICIEKDEETFIEKVLSGKSIIILSNDDRYLVANTTKIEKRTTTTPEIENTLRGSKDSFTENFDTNLSLIRYRLKDSKLRIDNYKLGKRTKTNVGVIYIEDIANAKYVDEIKKRINSIDIDGVLESGYIQKFILNNAFNLFPQVGIVERSDVACASILEGKVCIIVEGNNIALVTPKTFVEFLDASDDHYDSVYAAMFVKFIRIISMFISLTLSALYVAVVAFHSDILPPQYILALATSRATVPFNALVEATTMEFVSEILHEASIRLSKQIGPAIGIVGTIVIGQAAVSAGLVSPLMVIIVALSTMCSFVAPDFTIMSPVRILKFFVLFVTGIFGLFGFVMGLTVIVINIVSQSSFGVPYGAPIAPMNFKDLKNYFLSDITLAKWRPKFLKTQDKSRQ